MTLPPSNNSNARPDCYRCLHFFVTWDAHFPRGCRKFNMKTRRMPSEEVFEADGRDCFYFSAK